ncbi:MAG TPA: hypothetical protein VF806_09390 [Anaerolineaceae bacterium]
MELSSTVLILAGLIIAVLGVGAGMLLSSLNEEGEPEDLTLGQTPPGGKKGRFTQVARMWRENKSGSLVVEMDGKSFIGAAGLNDPQRERLEGAARDLRSWLGMGRAGLQSTTAPAAAPGAISQASAAGGLEAPQAAELPAIPVVTPVAPVSSVAKAAAAPKEATEPEVGNKSIVMQIEDILQEMIEGTPLEQRGIHLLEDPIKGVIVHVGLDRYEGIEAVTDPEAKSVIRAAVQEWEKSQ